MSKQQLSLRQHKRDKLHFAAANSPTPTTTATATAATPLFLSFLLLAVLLLISLVATAASSPFSRMRSLTQELRQYASGQRRRPPLRYQPTLVKVPAETRVKFEAAHCDDETALFLTAARDFSLWRLFATDVLQFLLVSRTTANGLLSRGGMFVLSTEQACSLLRPSGGKGSSDGDGDGAIVAVPPLPLPTSTRNNGSPPPFESLLDIGAGDGGVTARLAHLFERVFATEYSVTMRWRLRGRGYTVLGHESPFCYDDDEEGDETTGGCGAGGRRRTFDVVSCLNVLDRADTPLTLLRQMRDALRPPRLIHGGVGGDNGGSADTLKNNTNSAVYDDGGLLLLAVVLPWCPFVECNNQQRMPSELLPMQGGLCALGATFEASLGKLVTNVLDPVGLELVRWTQLPYLCEGNLRMEYALLTDAVLVLKRRPGFLPGGAGEVFDTATLAPASEYARH